MRINSANVTTLATFSHPSLTVIFRQLLGLEQVKWGDEFITTNDLDREDKTVGDKRLIKTKQTSLSDFLK